MDRLVERVAGAPRLGVVAFLSGGDWTGGGSSESSSRAEQVLQRRRRANRNGVIASGTIACPRCDAPVAIGPDEVTVTEVLTCPFCAQHGPVREFLSLAVPTRPTRVQVRLRIRTVG
jgi:hypothetical protein